MNDKLKFEDLRWYDKVIFAFLMISPGLSLWYHLRVKERNTKENLK